MQRPTPPLCTCWLVIILASCGQESAPSGGPAVSDAGTDVSAADAGVANDAAEVDAALDAPAPDVGDEAETSTFEDASEGAAPEAIVRGVSAWIYEERQDWAEALRAYDLAVQAESLGSERRLAYLFPYAGGASISGSTYGTQSVWYDSALIDYYAAELPDARILPIFDSADGNAFAMWSEADQRQLAGDVADKLLQSDHVAGAQVDIEPFRTEHLPFYDELGQRLHAQNKLLTVFTGVSSGEIYTIADVVVLSGYDLGISPLTPANYSSSLDGLISNALASAAAANTFLMVGVPITASWEEYAWQSGTCDQSTGSTQEEWFSAALAAACPYTAHPNYLGLALWGFYGDALEIPRGSGCLRHPGGVSAQNWASLVASCED